MTWVSVLQILLQLAGYVARRAERLDIEKALSNELEILQDKRVAAASAARDDVLAGRLPDDPDDPYRRD